MDIHETGLTVRFDQPSGIATLNSGETLAMKASASMVADMKLFVGNEPIATQSNVKEITAEHTFCKPVISRYVWRLRLADKRRQLHGR